jgi:hypothetical protein
MRREIVKKREKVEEEIRISAERNSSGSDVINKMISSKQKKIADDAKKEKRAINMVVTNSLVNFFLRLPEILVFFSSNSTFLKFIIFDQKFSDSNNWLINTFLLNNISSTLLNISYFCYILTFTFNVAINCVFNKKFRQYFAWSAKSIDT